MEYQDRIKPVWITGANGLIGNYLVQTAPKFAPHWRVRGVTRNQFDLLDFAAVRREFQMDQPQLVIHCAALSTVAEAQANPALARRVNVEVTKLLAELAAEIQFVFFSTDLVFDGRKGNYVETDATESDARLRRNQSCRRANRFEKSAASGRAHVDQRRHFARGQPRLQRAIAARVAVRAGDETVHGRISLSRFRPVETARAVWELAAQELRRTFSCRGRGTDCRAGRLASCWSGAGRS